MKFKTLLRFFLPCLLSCAASLYGQDGELDPTFAQNGVLLQDISTQGIDVSNDLVELPDGRIIVAGYTTGSNGVDALVMCLHPDGSLDSTFAQQGKAILDLALGGSDRLTSVALQNDGKIVAAGYFDTGNGLDFIVIRLTANGLLDTGFGVGGMVKDDVSSGGDDQLHGIAVQPDGKIVVVGSNTNLGQPNLLIIRMESDGSYDQTFGFFGAYAWDTGNGGDDQFNDVIIAPNGKILATGYTAWGNNNSNMIVARLSSVGMPDSSFSMDGFFNADLTIGANESGEAIRLYPNGKIIVAGHSEINGNRDAMLMQLNSSGILDNGFGNNGQMYFDIGLGALDEFRKVEIQSNSQVIAGGISHQVATGYDFLAVKVDATGELDTSFAHKGYATLNTSNQSGDNMRSMCLLQDDKILMGGYTSGKVSIIRVKNETPFSTGWSPRPTSSWIEAFPQPFSAQLWVKLPSDLGQEARLSLFSLTGQLVLNMTLNPSAKGELLDLSNQTSHLPSGAYMLRIESNEGAWTRKMLKQ